jgi:hypothetical protein
MDLIVNYWVWMTPTMNNNMVVVLPIIPNRDPREPNNPLSTLSVQFPLLNHMRSDTKDMLRWFPGRRKAGYPLGLWNCLARADGLYALTAMREDLQKLTDAYPDNFRIGGCWDYATGQPIGGVGSPWFNTPPGLADILPPQPQPQPPNTEFPPTEVTPPLAGVLWDVTLGAGQASRVFI